MKYAIKTRGTNSGNNPVGTIVYDLRGHESELQELRLLIDEYDPTNSDWNFRRGVLLDVLVRLWPQASSAPSAERCPYCSDGKRTGLPGNACENCMNTGLAHPSTQSGSAAE